MPSPGRPKTVSTPQSISRVIRASAAMVCMVDLLEDLQSASVARFEGIRQVGRVTAANSSCRTGAASVPLAPGLLRLGSLRLALLAVRVMGVLGLLQVLCLECLAVAGAQS